MRRRLDVILPVVVLAGFVLAALVVNLLLASAQRQGIEALEEAVAGEVRAIAGSQDQRVQANFAGAGGIVDRSRDPFTLQLADPGDLARLEGLYELVEEALDAGFYLIDADGTITQGILIGDASIGTRFDWPGFSLPTFLQVGGAVLPVADGLTVDGPVSALVLGIYGPDRTTVRGGFVVEQPVAFDSPFNREIGPLRRGDTGEYLFYDSLGTAIAANDPSLVGRSVGDERLLLLDAGIHRFDGRLLAIADVPAAGWRVAFRQDLGEFEASLAQPVQDVGRVLVIMLLAGGAAATILLARRLRAAREEQERLRRLSAAQQELISIVSHELRTPVAGVLGFLESSLDHWDQMSDDERLGGVRRAASNARRLQAMTRDILDTESIEAGHLTYTFEPVDLVAEVRVAVESLRDLDAERAVELRLPAEPVWVDADADRLHQVLANLLDNARRSSPALLPIEVEVIVEADAATITVADHGPGIDEDLRSRIFDKFVRGPSDSVGGSGLGLYISERIVAAHGGRITLESGAGEGARFHVTLPRRDSPMAGAPA